MTTVETFGKIEGGKLILHNRRRFEQDIQECKDQEVIVIIKKRGRRSNQQNAYYWAVVVAECRLRFKELGHRLEADEVHQFLKEKFLPVHILDEFGTILATLPGTTTTLNKTEMSDYIERIREWAAQTLEINIPSPNSNNSMNF